MCLRSCTSSASLLCDCRPFRNFRRRRNFKYIHLLVCILCLGVKEFLRRTDVVVLYLPTISFRKARKAVRHERSEANTTWRFPPFRRHPATFIERHVNVYQTSYRNFLVATSLSHQSGALGASPTVSRCMMHDACAHERFWDLGGQISKSESDTTRFSHFGLVMRLVTATVSLDARMPFKWRQVLGAVQTFDCRDKRDGR